MERWQSYSWFPASGIDFERYVATRRWITSQLGFRDIYEGARQQT